MPPAPQRLLIVTGMAREAAIAAALGQTVVQAGGDPARLRALLDVRGHAGGEPIISFGVAGGLDPAVKPGDVVVATGIVSADGRVETDAGLSAQLAELLAKGGLKPIAADLVGVDVAVADPSEKAGLYKNSGAVAVDMESHVAQGHAARHGVPFAAIRVVIDPAARALPKVAAEALKPDGTVDGPKLAFGLLKDPTQIIGLIRLAGDAKAAFAALTRCRDALAQPFGRT